MVSRTSSIYRKTKSYFPIVFIRMMMQMLSFKIENVLKVSRASSDRQVVKRMKSERRLPLLPIILFMNVYTYIFS